MTCRAAIIEKAGSQFKIVTDHKIPEPQHGQVQIKVLACGICHSDNLTVQGLYPGITFPRAPGHEIVGHITKLGDGVAEWKIGQLVGLGWHGSHCFTCTACRDGKFILCSSMKTPGVHTDGGYSEFIVANHQCLAAVPDGLKPEEAAPLLCAGITVYNSMRNSNAKPGDLVAIHGIGGLGHLAIQYANKMGFNTAAISTSADKKELAHKLGAHVFIDTSKENAVEVLQKLGGAKLIVATVTNSKAMSDIFNGLGTDGTLLVLGADHEPLHITPLQLLMGRKSIQGWPSGTGKDSEDTLKFSKLTGVVPHVEVFPLEKVQEAYELMMSNKARFRVVIKHA